MLHPYGLIIAAALLAGYIVAFLRKRAYGFSSDDLDKLFLIIIPFGITGARTYHVLDKWSYYSQNAIQIFAVWNGGLGIYGGIIGGIIGVWIFTKIISYPPAGGLKLINLLDFIMPSLALGQAIGRWGNFFNHEVFGPPTNLPWKWYIPQHFRPEFWQNDSYFHPVFAYESLWVLLGFILLIIFEKYCYFAGPASARVARGFLKKKSWTTLALSPAKSGLLTGFYAIWYGSGRFFLEFLRFDTAEISGIKTAQIISVILIGLGIFLIKRATEHRA